MFRKGFDGGSRKIMWDGADTGNMQATENIRIRFTPGTAGQHSGQKRGIIVVDNNAPQAGCDDDNLFSPNGDGKKDSLVIRQKINSGPMTNGRPAATHRGNWPRSFTWKGVCLPSFSWDGRTSRKKPRRAHELYIKLQPCGKRGVIDPGDHIDPPV